MRMQMASETPKAKKVYCVMGAVVAIITLIWGSLLLMRAANANAWDSDVRDAYVGNPDDLGHVYDVYPIAGCKVFRDEDLATKLKIDIGVDCNADCLKEGTKWSLIYTFNGVVLILLCFSYLLVAFGAFVFHARVIGACLNCWLGFVHFPAILVTAVYRFNSKGRLAADCLDPSSYDGAGKPLSDSWTFDKDGELITGIWACQLLVVFFICCLGSMPLRFNESPKTLDPMSSQARPAPTDRPLVPEPDSQLAVNN